MNQQSFTLSDNADNEPIELETNQKNNQLHYEKENLQHLILEKTKQFWVNKFTAAKFRNIIELNHTAQNTDIKEVIKLGLELQQYLDQDTEFYHLYTQQIKNDFTRFKGQKKQQKFQRKAKLMLERYLDKYEEVKVYLLFPFNWVKQRVPSFPHLIKDPICIKQIQNKLRLNLYQNFQSFQGDIYKMFNDFLMFNRQNKQLRHTLVRLKNNWTTVKYEVLQIKNFAIQPCVNPTQQILYQALDMDQEIILLREKVSIDKNMSQYLDYDLDFLTTYNLKNNGSVSNSSEKRKKSNQKKKSQSKDKQKTKKVFESSQAHSKTVGKQRIIQLKKNISKCIATQMAQKDLGKRMFFKYINEKRKSNPNFIGSQNQINLQNLGYEEFIELQDTVKKYLNYF